MDAVVLVVIDVGGPGVDGVVRLVAVGDVDGLEHLANRRDVGQAVIGEVPVGQRDAGERVEAHGVGVLARIGGDERIEQHVHRS